MEEEPSGLREQRMEAKTITRERTEIERRIDIIEEDIAKIDVRLLKLLLQDKTTKKNILWCTTDYENLGSVYDEHNQILLEAQSGKVQRNTGNAVKKEGGSIHSVLGL